MNKLLFCDRFSISKKLTTLTLFCLSALVFPVFSHANSIGDFVWEDLNANGIQDPGEPGIPNIPVYLYDSASNFVEGTSTDANGFYQITNIVAGNYFISLPIPLSFPYFVTTNNVGDDNFDSDISAGSQSEPFVYSGVAITNVDAGYVKYTPGIAVTKLASDPVKSAPDGTPLYVSNNTWVTYTYIITNTGDANLSFVFLSDDVLFPGGLDTVFLVACPDQFAPGQVITYTTQVLVNASVTNLAYVQALPVNFKTCDFLDLDPVEDDDDAVVLLVSPGYDFEKTLISPTGRAARVGENIQFTISVVNTGDVDLVVVPVVDSYDTNYIQYVSSVPPSVDNVNDGVINWTNIGPIAAFSSGTITATFTAIRSSFSELLTNVAITAPSTPTNVPGVPPQTNDAPYDISQPGYTLLKTVVSPAMPTEIGETIVFNLSVVNTGDVALATVPLTDTYDTNYLSYISSVPASDDNTDDGAINWSNVGPLVSGQSTNVLVSFLAITNTAGLETNTVIAAPVVPPDEPPVPPQTSSVPYEVLNNAFLELDKEFISATEPDTNGNFEITYTITVVNSGESTGFYNLTDTPAPDTNVTISGGAVTGYTNLSLVGPGPYLLASNETILASATHVYTMRLDAVLSAAVLSGEDSVSLCGGALAPIQQGEGLYNEVELVYGDENTRLFTNVCGNVPPFLILDKSFLGTTDPDAQGNFTVTYQIAVQNVGGTDGVYDLTDTPDPDPNVSILGGVVTGHSNATLVGSGPYSIVVNEIIAASATHIYTVRLDAALSSNVLNGSTTVSQCSGGEDDSVAGEGLFNEAVLVYGSSDTAITNDVCGDIPPLLVLEKDFVSATDADNLGNFEVTYVITVQNAGGSAGSYDLNENPQPDPHVNILGGDVTGHSNVTLVGSGPYNIVSNETILAGATHVYTVRLDAVVSSDILNGEEELVDCGETSGTPQAFEGLFNEAIVIYGENDTTITNDACGDLPEILVLEKDFLSTTDPDAQGNFTVTYVISVLNNGGSSGVYDLTDTPSPDPEVTINGGDVTGHTNKVLAGAGPYIIVTNESIAAGVTHVYTVRLDAVLSADILDGSETVSQCGTGLPQAGEGLYNEAVVEYGIVSITNDACGEIPPFIVIEKDFISATEADNLGNFQFEYVLTVLNSGGNSGSYDLIDDPSPDANIIVTNGAVTGHIPQALVGAGPYTLATAEAIGAGVTHSYTVRLNAAFSGDILTGTTNIITCGETTGTPQPDEALFNVAVVTFGDNDTTITNDACGDAPPFIVIDKEFIEATAPDDLGNFEIEYVVTVKNSGGSSTDYDLTDTPSPDTEVTIQSATISGHTNLVILGAGPYTLATLNTILVGETHTYTVRLAAVLSADVLDGSETVSQCGEDTGTPAPGEGLYNEAEVTYGDDITVTTNDCGDVPPFMVIEKDFISASDADAQGRFIINYQITVQNVGGSAGTYNLQDVAVPDINVTITGGVVYGQANFALVGAGPWTLALNEPIAAATTHVYNVELYAELGIDVLTGVTNATTCGESTGTPQGGEGLYNEAIVTFGDNDISRTNDACGEIPPFIILEKEFIDASDADLLGNFTIDYQITVRNVGGSDGFYDLTDTPSPDPVISITGGVVTGHSNVTLVGSGPYSIVSNELILAAAMHVYTIRLDAVYSPDVQNGDTTPGECGELGGAPQAGEGLFNLATVQFGDNDITVTNEACGDAPPFLLLDKNFLSVTGPDVFGNIAALYEVTVFNSGGSDGVYDLTDTPAPDVNVTFTNGTVTGHTNLALLGGGPYTLATAETIGIGVLHVYTVQLNGVLSSDYMLGNVTVTECTEPGGTSGEALFNEVTLLYGETDVTLDDNDCGDIPDVPRTNIGDTVWIDLNSNGSPDENLAVQGLNNVRVDLYNILGGVTNFVDFRLTTTNGVQRGYYLFTNLTLYGVYMAQVDISTVPPTVNVPTTPTRYFVPPTVGLNADFGFMPGTPTAVELVEFRAEVFANQVRLIWETATELDNMGFNLYRASSPSGERTRINDELIPGRGTGLGGSYQFDDPGMLDDGTYYYWLEDVEYNFSTREHGPLRVTLGSPSTVTTLGSTSIQNDGVVMITSGTFERSGINPASVDPSRLRVFIDGQEVAIYVTAYGTMLQSYDYILVYLDNETGDSQNLTVGYSNEGDPLRIGMDFAFVSGEDGDVWTGSLPDGAGHVRLSLAQVYARCLLTGFGDPMVWLFDITNAGQPVLLLGADTVNVAGEVGLYFSYPHQDTELIAVGADGISELDSLQP